MSLRPKPRETQEIPTTPEVAYREAVADAIACLERCYHNAADFYAASTPIPASMLNQWAVLLNVLARCSDALIKL